MNKYLEQPLYPEMLQFFNLLWLKKKNKPYPGQKSLKIVFYMYFIFILPSPQTVVVFIL